MDNEKIFELMTKMYSEMQNGFKEVKTDIKGLKEDVTVLKEDMSTLKEDITILRKDVTKMGIIIDEEIKPKIEVLFDGYKQNSEQIFEMRTDMRKVKDRLDTLTLQNLDVKEEVKELRFQAIQGGKK